MCMCKFTPSDGFNKCVQRKLRLLEPTPLYSFVIILLNLTFAYFFMLSCENIEVIRWPLFSWIQDVMQYYDNIYGQDI